MLEKWAWIPDQNLVNVTRSMVSQTMGCDPVEGHNLLKKGIIKFSRIIENTVEPTHSFFKLGSE